MSYRTENSEHQLVHILIKMANSPHLLFFVALNSLSEFIKLPAAGTAAEYCCIDKNTGINLKKLASS